MSATAKPPEDTVNLCSLTAYPGDDEMESLETDIMVKWKLDQPPDVKPGATGNKEEAANNLDLAKKTLREGKHCDALVYIDLALEQDGGNPALWLQRATVLIALGDLREAFRSCAALHKNGRSGDLWKMGGSILDKLGLPVTAETWLRNANKFSAEGDTSAAILFQKTRAKRLYGPLTQDMPVEVTFTNQGRAVKATKALKKGDVIFADKPILHAQTLPTLRFPCCANCVKSLIHPEDVFSKEELGKASLSKALKKHWPVHERFPCTCGHETYCSKACREEAWQNYHRLICPQVNPKVKELYEVCASFKTLTASNCSAFSGWWAASFSPVLLAKLWAQIVCSALQMAKEDGGEAQTPSPKHWALARAPYRRFIAYGSGLNADSLHKMYQLMVDIFKDLGDGLSYTITKEEFSGRYLQLACNTQSFSDADNPMGHMCRGVHSDPQFSLLLGYVSRKEHEADFAGLFPIHACLNHSCSNNAFVSDGKTSDGKPGCHVKAKTDISAGEEVCNQYIDTQQSRAERRQQLYRSYHFWCQCLRCQFEGDGPATCTECQTKSSQDKPFPKCSRCKQAWYCSQKCQKRAWKRGHKKICRPE